MIVVAGCSSDPEPDAAVVSPPPQPAQSAKPVLEDSVAKMARAVGNGKPGAAVDLRYDILAKPEVGKATEVEVAFIPSAGVDALNATISGMEGITLAGQLTPSYDQVEAGKAYKNTFSLLPDRTGVYYLTVSVSTQMGGVTLGRTFSIPLVVGDLQSQQKAVANPAKDASGQAIESMKAEESKR